MTIIQVPLISEREFLVKTTSTVHKSFNPEELEKAPEEIMVFLQSLYVDWTKEAIASYADPLGSSQGGACPHGQASAAPAAAIPASPLNRSGTPGGDTPIAPAPAGIFGECGKLVATGLEILDKTPQAVPGGGMNVVQQQDTTGQTISPFQYPLYPAFHFGLVGQAAGMVTGAVDRKPLTLDPFGTVSAVPTRCPHAHQAAAGQFLADQLFLGRASPVSQPG